LSLFDEIRAAAAEVTRRARSVAIDEAALECLAAALADERPLPPSLDPAHEALAGPGETLALVVTLDAINFGSGWFPALRKRPGCSGYLTVAGALRERFAAEGPWSARELAALTTEDCARLFGQQGNAGAAELMALFAQGLNALGGFLRAGYGGRFEGPVEEAAGSAERLVRSLARMPFYRDVASYQRLQVPFYKRAQLTCADLALAFEGRGPGAFRDLDGLTLFADNLVPHVLRMKGVLRYAPALAARIDAQELLAPGSAEEVEIRAVALHAVERLAAACAVRGLAIRPAALDQLLWARGQAPEIKAVPRHRTRCTYY
jgi:Queuosine salvage protein